MKKLINTFLRYYYLKKASWSHGNRYLIEACKMFSGTLRFFRSSFSKIQFNYRTL
jgi:hypothetical protein